VTDDDDAVERSHDGAFARRGLTWTLASVVTLAVAQLSYTSVTARIVPRGQFGYYASAQALGALAGYVALASLGSAVMRHPRANGLRRASFTLSASTGLVAGGLVALLGGVWAASWGIPGAEAAVRLTGLSVALTPVTAVLAGLQRRNLRYRHAAAAEFTGTVAGFVLGVVLALQWHTALALILGQGIASAVTSLLCLPRSRPVPVPDDKRVTWRDLSGFATNVSAQNFVYYVIYNLPPFSIARTLGAAALGGYSRANVLVILPLTQLLQTVSKVLYPLWARRSRPEQIKEPFSDVLVGISLIGALGFGALAGAATPITSILLGSRYEGIDDLVRILAVFGLINLQFAVSGSLQEASSWMRDVWRLQVIKLAVSVLLVAMVVVRDVRYAAAVLVLGQVVAHGAQLAQLNRRGVVALRRVGVAYVQHLLLATPAALALWAVTSAQTSLGAQIASVAVAVAVMTTLLLVLGDRLAGIGALARRGLLPARIAEKLSRGAVA
jgi:O-antigen/teichoic acid export membrane protein